MLEWTDMATSTVSAKVPQKLREEIEAIAKAERRTISNMIQLAIEDFVRQYNELHPQFRADILEALEAVKRGEVEPYEYG
ncbi:MAG: ribbon-helix-helix protein, CopG family [Candidatus Bipolaricaulota bacterium]|nr:ribbon-helix-helix protein, CopG family [Candidatus Bipolaricaulota bacterium]